MRNAFFNEFLFILEMMCALNLGEITQEFYIHRRTEGSNTKPKFFLHLTMTISAQEWNMLCTLLQLLLQFLNFWG